MRFLVSKFNNEIITRVTIVVRKTNINKYFDLYKRIEIKISAIKLIINAALSPDIKINIIENIITEIIYFIYFVLLCEINKISDVVKNATTERYFPATSFSRNNPDNLLLEILKKEKLKNNNSIISDKIKIINDKAKV
tara:strand:- start:404 stop:817 length:414 start_codon:yes stop_codon:yes gene_type:complete